jgi:undecaprenyl-diphosphatase
VAFEPQVSIDHAAGKRSRLLDFICQRDHRLMRYVNRWRAPAWIRYWMICATRGGDGWLWGTLAFLVAVFGGPGRFQVLGAAGLASAAGALFFLSIKRYTGRSRPCTIEPHCWAKLFPPDQFSFPSGHSITAFAVTTPLGLFYPALLPVLLFCAASVALSRILLGMHFLSDVAVGSGIGAALGLGAYLLLV